MLNRLKTYFSKGNTFYGLEIFQSGENRKFQLVKIFQKKGELLILESHCFEDLETVSKHINGSSPIHVVLNTANVITKHTKTNPALKNRAAVENLFPGLNFDTFYYQIVRLGNSTSISVCKQQLFKMVVNELKELKLNPVGISLGPSSLVSILSFIKEPIIYTNTEKITWDSSKDKTITISKNQELSQESYNVNGLHVTSSNLLGFAGVLAFLTNDQKGDSNFKDIVSDLTKTFATNRTFNLLLRIFIGFILGILIINFLVFSHYFGKTERIRTSLVLDSENKKNLTLIRERVAEKEKKVNAIISFSNSRASFYLDRLASTVPTSILLTEIQYQPLQKPIQPSKPIALQEQSLMVLGSCANSDDFSKWIGQLESFAWIATVETMDYDYKNSNSSEFKVHISVSAPKK